MLIVLMKFFPKEAILCLVSVTMVTDWQSPGADLATNVDSLLTAYHTPLLNRFAIMHALYTDDVNIVLLNHARQSFGKH